MSSRYNVKITGVTDGGTILWEIDHRNGACWNGYLTIDDVNSDCNITVNVHCQYNSPLPYKATTALRKVISTIVRRSIKSAVQSLYHQCAISKCTSNPIATD